MLALVLPGASPHKKARLRAYVYFIHSPDFSGDRLDLVFRGFAEVMTSGGPGGEGLSAPFENVFTTSDGFLARQVENNDPLLALCSFRWWSDGRARVHIPINVYAFGETALQLDAMQKEFLQIIGDHGFHRGRVAEMSVFAAALAVTAGKYLQVRRRAGATGSFFSKVRLCGTWRVIPCMNFRRYLEVMKKYGFPVTEEESMYCPPGTSAESLVKLDELGGADLHIWSLITASRLLVPTLEGIGIPATHLIEELGNTFYEELLLSMQDALRQKPVR